MSTIKQIVDSIPVEIGGYIPKLPEGVKIRKEYFAGSHVATILSTSHGFFVRKISTGVYFPAKSYSEAVGIRRSIVDRSISIDRLYR
jgi:hypothetical protein